MKKLFALLLALVMVFGLGVTAYAEDNSAAMDELIAAAKEEGSLVVYGSCEEEYLAAACQNFQKLYGIKTDYQRLSTGEVPAKIEEENGKPSADVWFGGTNNPYDDAAAKGLLEQYDAMNAVHLMKDMYKNPDGYWYGIYTGLLGFMVNRDELDRKGLEVPQTWDDLLKPEYKGLIWLSNYKTAGTPKLVANLMIQLKGHDEGIQYLVDLDKNIEVYTKSGSGPSKNVGTGECVIGIGFLHDGITQIVNAAKLFVEYALSPDCVELAAENGSYQFLVIDNAKQPDVVVEFGLDPSLVWDGYDFGLAVQDTAQNVEDVMAAIEGAGADVGEGRFQTS